MTLSNITILFEILKQKEKSPRARFGREETRSKIYKAVGLVFCMKLDPYNNNRLYEQWKKNPDNSNVSEKNNKIVLQYIFDMELGRNISRHSPKGARSYTRLNHLRQKIFFIAELIEKYQEIKDVTKVTENDLHRLFNDMRTGKIRRLDGGLYSGTGDYVKIFKAFWHWWQLVNHKKEIAVPDITVELDASVNREPEFVYFTETQLNEMIKISDPDMKVVMLFLFDTGMRVTEMLNIKVSDLLNDFKEVNIRQETSKTFGRRIKLMMCSDVIRNYVKSAGLKGGDFVFRLTADQLNLKLKPIGKQALSVDNLTLYDFRHSSACYWYPRYPNTQGLLYRFGWKKLEMAHYYARFLGMEDTITEESMLLGVTKTELEKEINKLKMEKDVQQKELSGLAYENKEIWKWLEKIAEMNKLVLKTATKNEKIKVNFGKHLKETISGEKVGHP